MVKALILVGGTPLSPPPPLPLPTAGRRALTGARPFLGFGTRLRPLTLSKPKPLVDFAGKPVVVHQLEALQRAGCSEVVLAINYQPELMLGFVQEWGPKLGLKITISRVSRPAPASPRPPLPPSRPSSGRGGGREGARGTARESHAAR